MSINDSPSIGRSFVDTLSYRPVIGKSSRVSIFPYRRNRLETNSCSRGETCRDQIGAISRGTGRECRLGLDYEIPQILSGA